MEEKSDRNHPGYMTFPIHILWTEEQFSKQLGVSRQTIISIENGKYNPSLELAFRIAKLFEKSIEDVFIFDEGSDE